MLITLLIPTSGTASVLGHDVVAAPREVRRHIGYVFGGDRGLYERLTASTTCATSPSCTASRPASSGPRIGELLELVGLTGREKERVEGFSRGMRQRLHIARGLLHDPEVLFLDEPTIGIDPVGARELRATIATLREQGKTILLTTHYMFEADELCDRIAVIRDGEIVAEGTPLELKRRVSAGTVLEVETFGLPDAAVDGRAPDPRRALRRASRTAARRRCCWCRSSPAPRSPRSCSGCLGGVRVGRVSSREPTLEDAYVELVSRREDAADARGRLLAAPQDARRLRLRRLLPGRLAAVLRDLRVPGLPAVRGPRGAGVRRPRLGGDGHLVGDRDHGQQPAAAGALDRHAGAAGRRADAGSRWCWCRSRRRWRRSGSTAWSPPWCGDGCCSASRCPSRTRCCSCCSIVVSIFSIALIGFLLSVAVVRYRTAWALGNLLEYPGWLVCGFLVPLALLPGLGHLDRLRAAADLGHGRRSARRPAGGSPWLDVLMCLGLGLVYGALGTVLVRDACSAPPAATRRCR